MGTELPVQIHFQEGGGGLLVLGKISRRKGRPSAPSAHWEHAELGGLARPVGALKHNQLSCMLTSPQPGARRLDQHQRQLSHASDALRFFGQAVEPLQPPTSESPPGPAPPRRRTRPGSRPGHHQVGAGGGAVLHHPQLLLGAPRQTNTTSAAAALISSTTGPSSRKYPSWVPQTMRPGWASFRLAAPARHAGLGPQQEEPLAVTGHPRQQPLGKVDARYLALQRAAQDFHE